MWWNLAERNNVPWILWTRFFYKHVLIFSDHYKFYFKLIKLRKRLWSLFNIIMSLRISIIDTSQKLSDKCFSIITIKNVSCCKVKLFETFQIYLILYNKAYFIFLYMYLYILSHDIFLCCMLWVLRTFHTIWISMKPCEIVRASMMPYCVYEVGVEACASAKRGHQPSFCGLCCSPCPPERCHLHPAEYYHQSITHHWWNGREGKDTN